MENKLLNTGALILFTLIMTGLILSQLSAGKYKTSNISVLEYSLQDSFLMAYGELEQLMQGSSENIVFVDLREADIFSQGHVRGAVNIPKEEILSRKHRKTIKDPDQVILYAGEENEAVHAALLLFGNGHDNIRVLAGNYDLLNAHMLQSGLEPTYRYYKDDKARFDYPRYMETGSAKQASSSGQDSPLVPQIKTEVITVQGGC